MTRTRLTTRYTMLIVVSLIVAAFVAHPATRPVFLAFFPALARSWRAVVVGALICAGVFTLYRFISSAVKLKEVK